MLERHVVNRHGELQGRNAAKQRVEDDLQFGAGKLLTYALVPSVAERDVLTGTRAMQVQPVRFGEFLGVPVRRRIVDDDAFSGPDYFAGDVDILRGNATLAVLDDGQVAQQFLDGVGNDA